MVAELFEVVDSGKEELNEKFRILDKIKKENFELNEDLYMRIKHAIKFKNSQRDNDSEDFLQDLPPKLRIDLAYIVHIKNIQKFNFFRNKSKKFAAIIAQLFKPLKILKGGLIHEEGEGAEHIYFLTKGAVSYVYSNGWDEIPFLTFREGFNWFKF